MRKSCHQGLGWMGMVTWLGACAKPVPLAPTVDLMTAPPGEVRFTEAEAQSANIQVAPVAMQLLGDRVVTSARVTYNDLLVAHITSPVNGRLIKVIGQLGQSVHRDAPLALIASPDMGNASSDADKAAADLQQATLELARQKSLLAAQAASQRDYENALDTYERNKSEYERAQKKMRLLSEDANSVVSQNYILRSAINGEIISKTAFLGAEIQGQYAGGSTSDLFVVADLREVWVIADLHEADLGRVQAGQKVTVVAEAMPEQSFAGQVDWVSDLLDPTTRTARVRCVVQNPQRQLKPDMFASMTIVVPGHPVLAVPRSAVVRMGEKTVVFVAAEGNQGGVRRFIRRPVIVDDDPNEEMLPVSHGLAAGETIVVHGGSALAEHV